MCGGIGWFGGSTNPQIRHTIICCYSSSQQPTAHSTQMNIYFWCGFACAVASTFAYKYARARVRPHIHCIILIMTTMIIIIYFISIAFSLFLLWPNLDFRFLHFSLYLTPLSDAADDFSAGTACHRWQMMDSDLRT